MHSTAPHTNRHFYYHTFSAATATKLRTCKYVEIKVPGEFQMHARRTPAIGTANSDPTWHHAMVSDSLPCAKDHAQPELLLQHFTLLCATAKEYGKILRRPEDPQLYDSSMTARDMCGQPTRLTSAM